MKTRKILVIDSHPDGESFGAALAGRYHDAAQGAGHMCQRLSLRDLTFDPILRFGYRKRTELEPDLIIAQKQILWADHIVFLFPTWWGTFPALLKGFIDRVFLPGFAFRYREGSALWDKLLKGRSARLIITMDSPRWWSWLVYGDPGHKAMRKATLEFCGFKPVRSTTLVGIKHSSETQRLRWLSQIANLGAKAD